MPVKRLWHIECMESSGIDVGDADARRILQGGQAGRCCGLAPLDHAQTFRQYFAGILVTAGGYQSLDDCLPSSRLARENPWPPVPDSR